MAKKCIYCSGEISAESAVDVCDNCGHRVWGSKMFEAIKDSMQSAKAKGDLFQGSVGG